MKGRLGALVVVAAIGAALFGACSSGKRTAEILNRDGNRQYAAGDYPNAIETYRQAEVLRPDLPALNYNAANALNRQNDFARSLQEGQRATFSTDAGVQDRAYYGMGDAYVHTSQLREALDAYKSALRANPADMDAKYNLEVIQRRLDQQQASQQQQQDQAEQQAGQQNQEGQQGQAQAGQGQPSAEAQPQPGQQAQDEQAQAAQAGPGQQTAAGQNGSGATGYTGTPAGQADTLDPNLKRALDQFNQTGSIDDALRALDIAAQQERLRQSGNAAPPNAQGRDW
jgi:Ca-activated chloride channel family protein